ncbi:nuclear transport factor 2 domain-containing protein [Saccharata proteae CBS 121410]|uniref:Nuclear transport factor 2 domain-containing protein n=1 Tax=Saccharata proteae CBS 121410 TaxID=1314787 RepID=A0A9P4HZN5_9PEZI|nr:nuclear transport factor 2 domain-containing protein [Saccharata proteae CBS 121410]
MPDPTADVLVKTSVSVREAAETLSDTYYPALQNARHTLHTFYLPHTTLPDGKIVPSIVWNGNVFDDPIKFQKMFEAEMPYTFYDVQSLDVQVLNPRLGLPHGAEDNEEQRKKWKDVDNVSLLVMVSGFMRLEERRDGPTKMFSETFVLVPNPERGGKKDVRKWLIQTQNLRYVV